MEEKQGRNWDEEQLWHKYECKEWSIPSRHSQCPPLYPEASCVYNKQILCFSNWVKPPPKKKQKKQNELPKRSETHPTWSQPDTTHLWGICWRAASWGVLPLSWRILWHPRGQRWLNRPPSLTLCPYGPGSLAVSCCIGWKKEKNIAKDKRDFTKRQ